MYFNYFSDRPDRLGTEWVAGNFFFFFFFLPLAGDSEELGVFTASPALVTVTVAVETGTSLAALAPAAVLVARALQAFRIRLYFDQRLLPVFSPSWLPDVLGLPFLS